MVVAVGLWAVVPFGILRASVCSIWTLTSGIVVPIPNFPSLFTLILSFPLVKNHNSSLSLPAADSALM